jgi:hypothetical protein
MFEYAILLFILGHLAGTTYSEDRLAKKHCHYYADKKLLERCMKEFKK